MTLTLQDFQEIEVPKPPSAIDRHLADGDVTHLLMLLIYSIAYALRTQCLSLKILSFLEEDL